MNTSNNNILVESYLGKFSEEEFKFIISLLPHSKLIKPVKKFSKDFRNDIRGFRVSNLPIKILQDAYYNKIYKTKHQYLLKYTENLIYEYLKEIDKAIEDEIDSVDIVSSKIENDDREYFEKLTNLLLKTRHKENIYLYFKMIDFKLSKSQEMYLNNEFKQKILVQELECEIKERLDKIYESDIEEIENKYKSIVDDYECIINEKEIGLKLVQQKLIEQKNYFELELSDEKLRTEELIEGYKKISENLELEMEQLKGKISTTELLLTNLRDENICKDNKIKSLSSLLDLKYDSFYEIAYEKWIKDNEKLVKERDEIKKNIESLTCSKEEIIKEISCLNLTKSNLENKITNIDSKAENFLSNIKEVIELIGFSRNDKINQISLYKVQSEKVERELEMTEKKTDFIDDLASNLIGIGISIEYALYLAQYIYATFSSKMNLLLVGYNSRKIAEAISCVINGINADIITLPLGYNNCNELILTVNNSKSRVVLIENAVDNISENIYIPLIKENKDKLLVFSIESSENISILPKSIFNYMMLVDIDTLLSCENNNDLIRSKVSNEIFNNHINISEKNSNIRHISELDKIIKLGNVVKIKLAEVMCILDKLNTDNSMYNIILFYINILCKCNNKTDELREFIKNREFSPVIFKMLQCVLEDGQYNE